MTNLRLLDFDLRDDWPDISVQTFSAKNADQKQRISGTEWALFRLFEIWDVDETAQVHLCFSIAKYPIANSPQKLQPFFPPLEPLQSLNLRAALYRSLNELKKNGLLGRDSVLRKTMLDECKGEKFYEILAIFSNAVLKKVLASRKSSNTSPTVARKLATSSVLSSSQQKSLLPLAIAHKASLTNILKRKEEKRRKYLDFEELLDAKADDINRRIRRTKETPRAKKPAVPQREADAVKRQLKDNWIGDQKWLEVMLHGDDVQTQDAFLHSRFDKVWRMVEAGKQLQEVVPEAGLLQNLQARVQEQQDRLKKWKTFHQELQKDNVASIASTAEVSATVKSFRFDDHLQYQLPSRKRRESVTEPAQRPKLRPELRGLLADMDDELLRASKSRYNQPTMPLSRRRRSSSMARSPVRSRKNTRSESIPKVPTSPVRTLKPKLETQKSSVEKNPVLPPSRQVPITATPLDSEATLVGQPSTLRNNAYDPHALEQRTGESLYGEQERDATPLTSNSPEEASSSPPAIVEDSPMATHSPNPLEPTSAYLSEPLIPRFEPPVLSAEEALAEQIVNDIGNATPSPVKKTQPRMSLSLVERTRMSMARTTSFEAIDESPLPQASPELPVPPTVEPEGDRRATLLERTRLSMMAMQAKPRPSMSAREKKEKRKSRQSLFPVNQFDTPRTRKSFELIEEARSSDPQLTPKEILFSDEVDYDRVFKSRPRIATSPVFSPGIGDGDEDDDDDVDGVTGIDLRDVDQDDDDAMGWADSPSRRPGVRY